MSDKFSKWKSTIDSYDMTTRNQEKPSDWYLKCLPHLLVWTWTIVWGLTESGMGMEEVGWEEEENWDKGGKLGQL